MSAAAERAIDRAIAKLTSEAKRTADDLAKLRSAAEVLPQEIRNAIEEIDLLRHYPARGNTDARCGINR
jgi:hypothetical protein